MGAGWNDFEAARIALSQLELSAGDDALERVLADATRISASSLSVERVGVWVFEASASQLRCIWQHDGQETRENIPVLRAVDYPIYIGALRDHRFIAADDARIHPLTSDLSKDYLEPLGITSMLDAPVYRGEEIIGIVCHEHSGPPRQWSAAECDLAGTVADVIALVFEQARRIGIEEELAETRAKLRELGMLDDMTRIVAASAHDLNNLLTIISTSLALLRTQADKPDALRATVGDLTEVTERAALLVRNLMGVRRVAEPQPERINLVALLQRLTPVLRALLGTERTLQVDASPVRSVAVMGELLGVEQAIVNLITNAGQASEPSGTVYVSVATQARSRDGQSRVYGVLTVRDEGTGMSDEVKLAAREAFFTTRRGAGGTGLGLHIVESVAQRAGGFVEIDSQLGQGTTVRVLLPLAEPAS